MKSSTKLTLAILGLALGSGVVYGMVKTPALLPPNKFPQNSLVKATDGVTGMVARVRWMGGSTLIGGGWFYDVQSATGGLITYPEAALTSALPVLTQRPA